MVGTVLFTRVHNNARLQYLQYYTHTKSSIFHVFPPEILRIRRESLGGSRSTVVARMTAGQTLQSINPASGACFVQKFHLISPVCPPSRYRLTVQNPKTPFLSFIARREEKIKTPVPPYGTDYDATKHSFYDTCCRSSRVLGER